MSNDAVPAPIDTPNRKQRRRRLGRLFSKTGLAATAAAAGLAVTMLGATAAHATAPLTNGPTIQLGTYNNIPASAPAYVTNGDLLPQFNGTLGNAVDIFMTGQSNVYTTNDTYALGIPGASTTWGTQVSTGTYTGATSQEWFFQRVGYVGVNTPLTAWQNSQDDPNFGNNVELAVPVYRILNYNPADPAVGFTCLESRNEFGAAGSIVESDNCNPNPPAQTAGNQLWIVGSATQTNDIINSTTGAFLYPGSYAVGQEYSDYLQNDVPSGSWTEGTLDGSVIENVASLWNNGWNTATAPVLSADYTNMDGINSGLQLDHQAQPAYYGNSTWNLVPAYTPAAPSTNNPNNTCSGISGFSVLLCGGNS